MRQLCPKKLQYALVVEPGMALLDEVDLDKEDLLASIRAGPVVLDKETNTLRLAHHTTQEYFEQTIASFFLENHAQIAANFVTFSMVDLFASDSDQAHRGNLGSGHNYPFFRYATEYWGDPTRKTSNRIVLDNVLKLLSQWNNALRASKIMNQSWRERNNFSLRHGKSSFCHHDEPATCGKGTARGRPK